jgi:hypothetical protein
MKPEPINPILSDFKAINLFWDVTPIKKIFKWDAEKT